MLKYDPFTRETKTVSTDLPSDPKDSNRKNKIAPTDVPMEKKRAETSAEQDQKPELRLPEWQRQNIQWTF